MKKLVFLLVLILIIGVGISFWWQQATMPPNAADRSQRMFVIRKGENIREIANNLKHEGLIRDPVAFFILVKQMGLDQKIQAGDFRLSPSQTMKQTAETLTHGSLDEWITIKEGQRADEIADILQKQFRSYNESWRQTLNANEGYLFPDTYLLPKDADIELIVSVMKNNFAQKYASIPQGASTKYTEPQIVTIASMVEREARHDADRPLIASVIYNRLNLGMALQIDATIQYAKGKTDGKWWSPVTIDDYKSVVSPYNTYLAPGLPPTPIANPGVQALTAAINPANTNYLYYITDANGVNRYAETADEHEANKRKYGLSL